MGEEIVLFYFLLFIDIWVRDEKKGWKVFFFIFVGYNIFFV